MAIILSIPLRSRGSQDRLTWKLEKKGSFSVKSCYWIACDVVLGNSISSSSLGDPFLSLWKALWKAKVPGKVAICAWRACNNLLPTREKLSNKGYSGDMRCLLCSHSFETIGHIICECPTAKVIFTQPPFSLHLNTPHSFIFKEWMLEQAISLSSDKFARLLMFVWSLWKNRNEKLWNEASQPSSVIISATMAWYESFLQANQSNIGLSNRSAPHSKSWVSPTGNCVCSMLMALIFLTAILGVSGYGWCSKEWERQVSC